MHMYVNKCWDMYSCVYIYIWIKNLYIYTYICKHTDMYQSSRVIPMRVDALYLLDLCICIYIYTYIRVCICMYLHMYIYVYKYQHIHKIQGSTRHVSHFIHTTYIIVHSYMLYTHTYTHTHTHIYIRVYMEAYIISHVYLLYPGGGK